MSILPTSFLLALSAFVPQAPLPAPTAADLPIYVAAIQDVQSSAASPAAARPPAFALDPHVYATLFPPPWTHGVVVVDSTGVARHDTSRTRWPDDLLRRLGREAGIQALCEPLPDSVCRGPVRGPVLRLGAIRRHRPDSVEVMILVTTARGERDRTVITPLDRYYGYGLVERNGTWRIVWARRAVFDPRAA